MLTEYEIRHLLANYTPPYHHEIRDEIREQIIACGEQVLRSVQPILDDKGVKDRHKALLESVLWTIGGNLIKDFFIKRAEYDLGSRAYIKELLHKDLLRLRETNPELLKKVFNYLPESIISFCASHQHQMQSELQRLGLTAPEESFDVNKEEQINPHSVIDCPVCGKAPNKQSWLYFWTPDKDWHKMRGRAGWIGICGDCNIQVSRVIREMN
jgi:hypothetical protein